MVEYAGEAASEMGTAAVAALMKWLGNWAPEMGTRHCRPRIWQNRFQRPRVW